MENIKAEEKQKSCFPWGLDDEYSFFCLVYRT